MIDNCLTADIIDNEVEAEVADFVVLYSPVTSQEKVANFVSNGTFEIVPNEGYVLSKVTANVNVPVPDGFVKPSGTLNIEANGKHNVANYAEVNVNVPSEAPNIQPLTITENGTYTASGDVDGYSPITVEVASSGGGDDSLKYIEARHETVNLPTATSIKANAFYNDLTIKTISFPNVTVINSSAFYSCKNLGAIELPLNLEEIIQYAFRHCNALVIDEIPATVRSIGQMAFQNCTSLKSITFKGTPDNINSNSFSDCTGITAINVPWAEGEVSGAPWGATKATINYNYTGE